MKKLSKKAIRTKRGWKCNPFIYLNNQDAHDVCLDFAKSIQKRDEANLELIKAIKKRDEVIVDTKTSKKGK